MYIPLNTVIFFEGIIQINLYLFIHTLKGMCIHVEMFTIFDYTTLTIY